MRGAVGLVILGLAVAWNGVANAANPCPSSLIRGTFSYSTPHYVSMGTAKNPVFVPAATAAVFYFDGVSQMQYQRFDSSSPTNPTQGTGTYKLARKLAADGVTTESCILTVTLDGSTTSQTYYLSLDGTTYYGVDDSQSDFIMGVQALRVSRPSS